MTPTTRRRASTAVLLCAALASGPAPALDLPLPSGAQRTAETIEPAASWRLPIGPWDGSRVPATRIDGTVTRRAWRIGGRDLTTLQILKPLRAALENAGWDVVFDCEARACGGFDFRFALDTLPAPEMYVDLTDFRWLSAEGPDGDAALGLLVSRDGATGYVQATLTGAGDAAGLDVIAGGAPPDPATAMPGPPAPQAADVAPEDLVGRLTANGHAILSDVTFASGASSLGSGPVASLDALAEFLEGRPDTRLLLVGHTDATGSLDANRAVSRARAESAAAYLRDRHGLDPARIESAGAGYLAPVASNLDATGRTENRRIEAVLLPAG
ncbi:OmpA family protein [Roseivivax marinus]|uniref:OmpA family protein n=1 Tax=Roseivivax marinus TaxID=1379903 RepID=UPI001F04291F|nr:OmpA family protein [Roseivivax marinus]UMA64849.1 OmpA family protein [Roseivivax marinus]